MTYIVSSGALNSTHSLTPVDYHLNLQWNTRPHSLSLSCLISAPNLR